MKMEKSILDLVKKAKPKLEIMNLRGLIKTGENEWSFRYTFRDGDYLSMSDLIKVKFDETKNSFVLIKNKKTAIKKTRKQTVKK